MSPWPAPRHDLPSPFHVLATQNPIEQEGTYPLPEAQLDRFLLEIDVPYPDLDAERRMLFATTGNEEPEAPPVFSTAELKRAQRLVRHDPRRRSRSPMRSSIWCARPVPVPRRAPISTIPSPGGPVPGPARP